MPVFQPREALVPIRAFHLDLKGMPPTSRRLVELLDLYVACRFNAILVEFEDQFPWTVDSRFRSSTCYTEQEIKLFCQETQARGLEIIPLVQCMGHMEMVLKFDEYAHLREQPETIDLLNPLAPGACQFVQSMIDDVLRLMPSIKRFHLGGDEAWQFASNPETSAYAETHGHGALYLKHVQPLLNHLNQQGIRPLLWHDMMIHWENEVLHELGSDADLVVWGYQGDPATTDQHFNQRYIQRFSDAGIPLWAATASKGADQIDTNLPTIQDRQYNAMAWIKQIKRFQMQGVIVTAWARHSTTRMQCEMTEATHDCMALIASIMHDGVLPDGGLDACSEWLKTIPAASPFEACLESIQRLNKVIQWAWMLIRNAKAQLVLTARDSSRHSKLPFAYLIRQSCKTLEEFSEIEDCVCAAFEFLVDPIWIEEYLYCRLSPLREMLSEIVVVDRCS
ncbi:family 20 glycosylhydrolase [Poriferisphaera sp. WC338]|uniref:family 20 glycosylhydrolase n=1 Tax=Poriferisphaera sp. WC338 TaxID=3425129 RepID=UPI003D817B20